MKSCDDSEDELNYSLATDFGSCSLLVTEEHQRDGIGDTADAAPGPRAHRPPSLGTSEEKQGLFELPGVPPLNVSKGGKGFRLRHFLLVGRGRGHPPRPSQSSSPGITSYLTLLFLWQVC